MFCACLAQLHCSPRRRIRGDRPLGRACLCARSRADALPRRGDPAAVRPRCRSVEPRTSDPARRTRPCARAHPSPCGVRRRFGQDHRARNGRRVRRAPRGQGAGSAAGRDPVFRFRGVAARAVDARAARSADRLLAAQARRRARGADAARDRPRPAVRHTDGAWTSFRVDATLVRALDALAEQRRRHAAHDACSRRSRCCSAATPIRTTSSSGRPCRRGHRRVQGRDGIPGQHRRASRRPERRSDVPRTPRAHRRRARAKRTRIAICRSSAWSRRRRRSATPAATRCSRRCSRCRSPNPRRSTLAGLDAGRSASAVPPPRPTSACCSTSTTTGLPASSSTAPIFSTRRRSSAWPSTSGRLLDGGGARSRPADLALAVHHRGRRRNGSSSTGIGRPRLSPAIVDHRRCSMRRCARAACGRRHRRHSHA